MTPTTQNLAFFGATGGCALAALTHSLLAGHTCRALARTPSKLTNLLTAASIPASTLSTHLTIISGSIDDRAAVLSTLSGAQTIIFGIGGVPAFTPNPLSGFMTLNDPTICERGVTNIVSALQDTPAQKPLMCVISSTGLKKQGQRDLPLAMIPVYKLLELPHRDKKKMEEAVVKAGREEVLSGYVIVRPALLTDGAETERKLRAGYQGRVKNGGKWGDQEGEAVGYTVSRKDVGRWVFEEVVEGRGGEWNGKAVSLAY
ncbi:hypothetical protein K440DRAFT_634321 [Wilcoxina mikolae CBS 423.85]|nr:hypothetical protein K440DRAFT_634321 [Wilcoxina mikolae CBS 423.85]